MTTAAKTHFPRRRSATRLAAIQALYEVEVADASVDVVLGEFISNQWRDERIQNGMPEPDADLLVRLVRGTTTHRDQLDAKISSALSRGWAIGRLEILLRSILRAGAYELLAMRDVPITVIINEYVDLTHAFFSGKEPALVNAVLDRLADSIRAEGEGTQGHGGGERDQ